MPDRLGDICKWKGRIAGMEKQESDSDRSRSATSFEESLLKLESIVADLEDGSLGLEESMQSFETGVGLLKTCYSILERAEQRIEILTGFDKQGDPEVRPFDAAATVDTQTGRGRQDGSKT